MELELAGKMALAEGPSLVLSIHIMIASKLQLQGI